MRFLLHYFFILILSFSILVLLTFFSSSFSTQSFSINNITPHGNPLGSVPYIITAYFHDPAYFKIFHKQHTGIDMVPKTPTDPTYIYATASGIGFRYSEPCSGNAVIIENSSYILYFGHISSYLFRNGKSIIQGQRIAIMGDSGELGVCVTGKHLHYELYKKISNGDVLINPLPYL